jgi:hypothetical protein
MTDPSVTTNTDELTMFTKKPSTANPSNRNLTLITDPCFGGLPVFTNRGPLIGEYLLSIMGVMDKALAIHPRTIAIRVDLRYPSNYPHTEDIPVITRFIKSLKAQIAADLTRKIKKGTRVRPSDVNYVWVKERGSEERDHYHLVLFFNRDTYNALGQYDAVEGNTAARIRKAWASALGIAPEYIGGAVYFPENPTYRLDARSDAGGVYAKLFYRLSYFAKAETKLYQDSSNHFGTSRR